MMGSMAKHMRVSQDRRSELLDDLRSNDPNVMRQIFRGYLQELGRDDAPATRLCEAAVSTWIVHAQKGDGALTHDERLTLDQCPTTTVTRPLLTGIDHWPRAATPEPPAARTAGAGSVRGDG